MRHVKNNRTGAIIPLMALLFPILLIMAGFAINIAYVQLTATEMQIATDTAARAAGRKYTSTKSETESLAIANQLGSLNLVAGQPLDFDSSNIEFGQSTRASVSERYQFVNTSGVAANSVRLVGARTDTDNGPVETFFPSVFGASSFQLTSSAISTQMEIDICIVFDRSGSMAYADNEVAVYPPIPAAAPTGWDFGDPVPSVCRWLDAVAAADEFLKTLTASPLDEKVALATYATGGTIDEDLTSDFSRIMAGLNTYTNDLDGGGTNIAAGLEAGRAATDSDKARKFAAKVVLIMTDGRKTAGPNPESMAKGIASDGGMLICVTFSDEADQALMKKLADLGNGFHMHANTKDDLKTVFENIAKLLPTLITK